MENSFLDVLVSKKADGTLNHPSVQKINTQIDTCMHSRTITQHKNSQQSTHLYNRAFTISDKKYLQTELNHLKLVLQKNGHDKKDNQNNQYDIYKQNNGF